MLLLLAIDSLVRLVAGPQLSITASAALLPVICFLSL